MSNHSKMGTNSRQNLYFTKDHLCEDNEFVGLSHRCWYTYSKIAVSLQSPTPSWMVTSWKLQHGILVFISLLLLITV